MSCTDTTGTFQVGDKPRVTGEFRTSNDLLIDPAVVRAKYKSPSGPVTSLLYGTDPALVKSSVGIYYVDIDATEAGTWYYKFYSTGSGQAAGEASFEVEASEFT